MSEDMNTVRPEREIVIEESPEALATRVASDAAALLTDAVAARESAHLVVTGGGILESVLAALASQSVPWEHVHVWWGDERYVPSDSDDRNDRPARAKLFDSTAAQLHPMPASDVGHDSAEAAADAYQAELGGFGATVPRFDVVLLGIGPDGHCASLFPDHPGARVVGRTVIAVHDSPKPPPDRLSLTFEGLHAASQVWVIASGSGKAGAAARALTPGTDPLQVPSAGAFGQDATRWLLDRDAASELDDEPDDDPGNDPGNDPNDD